MVSLLASFSAYAADSSGHVTGYEAVAFGKSGTLYFLPSGYGGPTVPVALEAANAKIKCQLQEIGKRIERAGLNRLEANCQLNIRTESSVGDFDAVSYKTFVNEVEFAQCLGYNNTAKPAELEGVPDCGQN